MTVEVQMPNYTEAARKMVQEWPSPLSYLDAAATALGGNTGNIVQGKVYVAPFLSLTRYTFYLVIPAINDYKDPLFYVWATNPESYYPVRVAEAGTHQEDAKECADAESFHDWLVETFDSGWVKARVRQWIELASERTQTIVQPL